MYVNKTTLSLARLVHVYVSMALLSLLLFFAVTGITLNHPQWFSQHRAVINEQQFELAMELLTSPPLSATQIAVVIDKIEQQLAISLENSEIESLSDELFIGIKKAGNHTAITIDLTSGELFYEHSDYGWWALVNDLHKGRNTSTLWGWIIDLTCVLFILFAISGFILAMPQRRFRRTLTMAVGTSAILLIISAFFA